MVLKHRFGAGFTDQRDGKQNQAVQSQQWNHKDLGRPADQSTGTVFLFQARSIDPADQKPSGINHQNEQWREQPVSVSGGQYNLGQI